jgi:hypothetical protein
VRPHVPRTAPFLRPRAIDTLRVVQKAVEAVYRDGLAMRCVTDRLARDFWVKPDEKMVRQWCRPSPRESTLLSMTSRG